jgi:hypothetical protein
LTSPSDNDATLATHISVFIDGGAAPAIADTPSPTLDIGPRIGPETLNELICSTTLVELNARGVGDTLGIGRASSTVPPRLRRAVLRRDGGACTVDGCQSTYRIETHHIVPWSEGGPTDEANLGSLCWFHHHVIIHRHRFRIDPSSPSRRRRFLPHEQRPLHQTPP